MVKAVGLQDVADYCGTIHYEIACGFTQRLKRILTKTQTNLLPDQNRARVLFYWWQW